AAVICLAAASDVVGRPVVDAGAHDGQPLGHVHRAAEVEQLHRDRDLVVVHADHAIEVPRGPQTKRRLRTDRTAHAHAGAALGKDATRTLDAGNDDDPLLAATQLHLTSM